eukprot:TRINITY_DN1630_c1_g1_i3.p1 TRINITY_DN1630_c1_g1~~TRINITY_DN1630_c1_g1_i3.p1  ORF type:complete len:437 (+),score=147.22 TRINITY_DN1630_c1_g1_i3:208-1518(+)
MRAVKSVLVAAGQLKRKEPNVDENILLIRAMRDSNVPKFLEHDLPLFMGIVSDLFPNVEVPYVDYGQLQTAIENEMVKEGLQVVPALVTKIIQVHETQLVRHGMMIVGESGSGKSTNHQILAQAITSLKERGITDKDGFFQIVKRIILNPKSITMGEMYGEFNEISHEWTDGLVAKMVRQACADESDTRKWFIFDGPVDALWIENMNTVLDDNKTLCLANGERIKLPSTLHMMFEVNDLAVASPATVSRCGMVYMEQVHVGLLPLVESWAIGPMKEQISEEDMETLLTWLRKDVLKMLDYVRNKCKEVIVSRDCNLVASLLRLLAVMLSPKHNITPDGEKTKAIMPLMYAWCMAWSFGGNINDNSRGHFDDFIKDTLRDRLPSNIREGKSSLFDYIVNTENCTMEPWTDHIDEFVYNPETPYFSLLVPTVDTTRYR